MHVWPLFQNSLTATDLWFVCHYCWLLVWCSLRPAHFLEELSQNQCHRVIANPNTLVSIPTTMPAVKGFHQTTSSSFRESYAFDPRLAMKSIYIYTYVCVTWCAIGTDPSVHTRPSRKVPTCHLVTGTSRCWKKMPSCGGIWISTRTAQGVNVSPVESLEWSARSTGLEDGEM